MRRVAELDGLLVDLVDGGGLYVEIEGEGVVVDASASAADALARAGVLPRVRGVVLTSGRERAVGGLVALLCALMPHRAAGIPLAVHHLLGEERAPALAEAWVRGWPDAYPLAIDAEYPGADLDLDPFVIETVSVRAAEPVWRERAVVDVPARALRFVHGDAVVAYLPSCAPGAAAQRATRGAALAIVEIGVAPWPSTERPRRLALADALRLVGEGELVLVGDDGGPVGESA